MKDQLVKELVTLRQEITELEPESDQMLKLLKTFADRSTIGIYIVQDGKFRFVNSVFRNYVGYSAKELLGMNSLSLVSPEDRDMVRQNAVEMLKGKRRLPYEFRYMSKDGEMKWVIEAVVSILYQGNQAALGSFMDITERKRIEEELNKSERFYRTILETAVDGYWCTDMEGRFLDVNDSYCQMVGYSREELLGGMSISDVEDMERPEDVAKRIKHIFEHGYDRFETRHRRKDGQVIDIEVSVRYLDLKGGQLVVFLRDITERKQAEDAVKSSKEQFQTLIENAYDTVMVLNDDGKVNYVSPSIKRSLGYEPEEWIGKNILEFVHQNNLPNIIDIFNEGIQIPGYVGFLEMPMQHKDGSWRTIEGTGTNLLANPSVAGIVANFRDVTERKQAKTELQELYEQEIQLREALEAEKKRRIEFTRVLVHELRTPLTPVLAASDLLVQELHEGTLGRLAKSISQGASDLSNRINDLLDLAKSEVGTLQLNFVSVDLLPMLQELADNITPMASSNGHSLILDLPKFLPEVRVDVNRLQQVILNLFNNASKFTPDGGKITLRARKNGTTLMVEVQDTGNGISEEEQRRLFEPYYRVESDRQRLSGLGLGLALCKTLVELHGGQIWVESCQGEGSTFSFSLPLEGS